MNACVIVVKKEFQRNLERRLTRFFRVSDETS